MKGWPRLPSPEFSIDAVGGPRSALFNDGYASPAGAAAETETVFLRAIGAPDIWQDRRDFAIGETGFGLGLNFLMTWAAWRRSAPPGARLHYLSVEGYPLDKAALAQALDLYRDVPGLSPLIDELCGLWPLRHAGFHRISLEGGRVQLTLLFGPVERCLDQITGRMDAWYLDGFAPARNPDMWSAAVFQTIAAKTRPGGGIATYTAAGHVRRGLEQAGFTMQKQPGYAHKRERLTGTLSATPEPAKPDQPWFALPKVGSDVDEVAIIGGGIGACCLWLALRAHGIEARLFDREGNDGGMGDNPAAMIAPKLPVDASLPGRLNALAFLKALNFYDALGADVWHGPRGVLQLPGNAEEASRQRRLMDALEWPVEVMDLEEILGGTSLSFPASGCLDPQAVRQAIGAPIEQASIGGLKKTPEGWHLSAPDGGEVWTGGTVVVAAGGWTGRLLQSPWLGIRPSRGQVSWINDAAVYPERGTGFTGGYLTPALQLDDGRRGRVLGSSFDAWRDPDGDRSWQSWSAADHARYAAEFAEAFATDAPPAETGWTGLRAMTPDRLPVVGPMPDADAYQIDYPDLHHGKHWVDYPPARYQAGLYVLSGFGARGYQFAPLMANLLADMIAGTPLPLEADLIQAVHPARFLVRNLKRAEA